MSCFHLRLPPDRGMSVALCCLPLIFFCASGITDAVSMSLLAALRWWCKATCYHGHHCHFHFADWPVLLTLLQLLLLLLLLKSILLLMLMPMFLLWSYLCCCCYQPWLFKSSLPSRFANISPLRRRLLSTALDP